MSENKRNPLYYQIKQYLYGLIYENKTNKQFILPSEASLCKMFNVSRITPKRALNDLKNEGLVIRNKGTGTTINVNYDFESFNNYNNISTVTKTKAQILKTRKTVALIIPDLKSKHHLNILDGIQDVAQKNDWQVILAITNYSQQLEADFIKKLILSVEGIIISPVSNKVYNREILRLSIHSFPLVLIDNFLVGIDTNTVFSDNVCASFTATEHFVKKNKQNIAVISQTIENITSLEQRYKGYEDCLTFYNMPIDKKLVFTELDHYDDCASTKIINFLLQNPQIDAILVFNYETGVKTLKAIQSPNINLSTEDVIIFDEEFEDIQEFLNIKVNYIKQNAYEIGKKAQEIICKQEKTGSYLNEQIKIPTRLKIFNND